MDIGIVTAENIKKVLGNASKEYYKRIIDSDERIDSKEANEDNEDFEINEDNKDKKDLKDKKDKKEKR